MSVVQIVVDYHNVKQKKIRMACNAHLPVVHAGLIMAPKT